MDQHVVSLVRKLILKNIPEKQPDQSTEQYDSIVNGLLRYLINILSSRMTSSHIPTDNELIITETIKKKFSRENHLQDSIKFLELCNRIKRHDAITKKWALIYLLYRIGNDNSIGGDKVGFSALRISHPDLSQTQMPAQRDSFPSSQSSTSVNNSSNTRDIGGIEPSQLQSAYQAFKNYENTTYEVDESDILRDVIFAFQGIDGKYVRYDSLIDGFIVDSKVGIPKATRDLVRKLCELGWLFKKLKAFVDSSNMQSTGGLVLQSFSSVVESELIEYYKLIAMLEGHTHSKSSITLRQLVVWTLEPMEKLKLISILVDACKTQRGGALLGVLETYARHGDPFVQSSVKKILESTCIPFFNMIKAWVFEGELEDPFQEFFVSENSEVTIEQMWFYKYSLKQEMLPNFITLDFGLKILKIGKTINFIRHCCNDTEFIIDSNTVALASQSFSYENIERLEAVINKIAKIANQRVMQLIFEKYKIRLHYAALRKYLLLGQGDFIQHLLDLLQPDLEKPSPNVNRHNLLAILESAIRGSNAQYDDKDVLDRLDVKMISSPSSTGWDVFCLDYKMTVPLNTIFPQKAMETYTKIFQFLWAIKRVESSLGSTWKRHMHLSRILRQAMRVLSTSHSLQKLTTIFHTCNIIRHNMVLFIGNIQYYLMFEVLECCWQELSEAMNRLQKNGDLDLLIQAHHKYLIHIIDQALLSKAQRDLKNQLEKVLHLVVEYIRTQDFVAMATEDIIQKQKLQSECMTQKTENMMNDDDHINSQQSISSTPQLYDESSVHNMLSQCLVRVQRIKRQYEEQSFIFLKMLERQQSNDVLEYLKHRLQYSANRDE